MKSVLLKVPSDVFYLSMWNNFDEQLPPGKIILNKYVCGCGCTDYYLTNELPVILVSPRKELIRCKSNDKRIKSSFYFDRSNPKVNASYTIRNLDDYLNDYFPPTPFDSAGQFPPKILVTYDSLPLVLDAISNRNELGYFTIIVDEFTCIFTDARLKGNTELNLIRRLNMLQNRIVYISATPMAEPYLDELEEFKDLPYVTLQWDDSRIDEVHITRRKMTNTRSAIKGIIEQYNDSGFFQSMMLNGVQHYSKEALFFLNSVNDIAAIIQANHLTPDNTLVICADEQTNREKLKKVGHEIGHVASKDEYRQKNKTFTFITKASFEGTDFYSDSSTTYIFADSNRENLCLDISIDLPQIIGRCRTFENPFRRFVQYFYQTTSTEKFDVEKEKLEIMNRMEQTKSYVGIVNGLRDRGLLEKFKDAQKSQKYKKDYLDVQFLSDGTAMAVCNNLVYLADLRAIEIKSMQYETKFSLLKYLNHNGYKAVDYYAVGNDEIAEFYRRFDENGSFEYKMRLYTEAVKDNEQMKKTLEGIADIPMKYKKYYNTLGAETIRALSYKEKDILRAIDMKQSTSNIRHLLLQNLTKGQVYSNADVKRLLGNIYQQLNLIATPKATLLPRYIPSAKAVRYKDSNGRRLQGYIIE